MVQMEMARAYSIEEMSSRLKEQGRANTQAPLSSEQSFAAILKQKQEFKQNVQGAEELKFSKHANERLVSRNIDLTSAQRERLNGAVKRAEAKGIKESLVMLDNLAFIVNVKNNTVVTAVTGEEERIFSNIDGAVIV